MIQNHLNTPSKLKDDSNYKYINNTLINMVKCTISNCLHYTRNNRNRESEKRNDDDDDDGIFYTDLLDNIHCYLIHSYDTGFRVINNNKKEEQYDDDEGDIDINNVKSYYDSEMNDLQSGLHEKRKKLVSVRGDDVTKHSKFVSDAVANDIKENGMVISV